MVAQGEPLNPTAAEHITPTTSADSRAQAQGAPVEYVDEFPAFRRLVRDIPPSTPFNPAERELHHTPAGSKDSGWQNCFDSVEKYDRELCQAYREQIDTLLVFAGLFSAVVTAFAVESYQWLQDDPMDTSVELLRNLVDLLAHNMSLTVPPTPSTGPRLSGPAIVRINSCWFLSLLLSLSAALVGILCKQWLREFDRNVGQSPETALAVRYIRFQGFEFWKVGSIVTSVPIIMQMALALFIIGIVELLWRLNTTVAYSVTAAAGLTLAFYLATTLLPVLQYAYICMRCYIKPLRTRDYPFDQAFTEPQCAFKSAQAWLVFRAARAVINRILRAYGYQFSSHRPPARRNPRLTLRPADSWVAFDLNWVRCRENIHYGPRCAFESLTWIAGNLGGLDMSSWTWHCVWARLMKNRDSPDDLIDANRDIAAVARSYPRLVALDDNHTPLTRSQALVFQCTLRSDLPINTAIELLLRVVVAGANSQWASTSLHAICVVYRNQSIHLSDDVATGLFRLAERQTRDIIFGSAGPDSEAQYYGALAFKNIATILHRGARLHDIFAAAISGFVLQWLRSRPPRPIAIVGRAVFDDTIWYLASHGYNGPTVRDLRRCRGILFIAKLADAVVELWPEARHAYEQGSDECAVLSELLAIFSEGFPELYEDRLSTRMEAPSEPGVNVDGERSNAPELQDHNEAHTGEEMDAESPCRAARAGETSRLTPHGHLCTEEYLGAETGVAQTEIVVNGPDTVTPVANPVAVASLPRNPSPDLPTPPSRFQHYES